jgi:type IV pilus assembly protein PilY1
MEWANSIIYATMQPTADVCSYGGRSRMWGLNCATGTSIHDDSCDGFKVTIDKVSCGYLQTSTAAIYDICSGSYSTQDGDRSVVSNGSGNQQGNTNINDIQSGQTEWMTGVTPETPPIIPIPPSALKGRILLWIEK